MTRERFSLETSAANRKPEFSAAIRSAVMTAMALIVVLFWMLPALASQGLTEVSLKDGETESPSGTRLIAVSLDGQELTLYHGTVPVARSRVSSGKPGHETPMGIYSILEKRRYHRSNIYSNAPMPFMQRLTWSGIALHESGHVPNRPASHGCIRLPGDFARHLFGLTERGLHVVVARESVVPRPMIHPLLPQPMSAAPEVAALRETIAPVEMASLASGAAPAVSAKPLRIYVTRITRREITTNLQRMLNSLGFEAGEEDGLYGRNTVGAVKAFQKDRGLAVTGMLTDELLDALYEATGTSAPLPGVLYVRLDHQPLFEVPVDIREPGRPLGTHFFLASADQEDASRLNWVGMPVATRLPSHVVRDHAMDEAHRDAAVLERPLRALDRLVIDAGTQARLAAMIGDGASFAISDNGLGTETGKGTDFIVQIR